jgi:hypothetical protein
MEPCVLHLSCLETVTEEQLQMRLWEKVGLWVELENIAITADYARKNFTALIVLDRINLADSLARWLQSTGETIVVAPAKSNRERHQIKRSKVLQAR